MSVLDTVGITSIIPFFSLASEPNNIYNNNNLNLWWNSDNLQNVRKLFCEKYCRHSKNPINDFKKSLIFNE